MKKLIAITLLLCLITTAFGASLSDIKDEHITYKHSIMYARAEAHRIGMDAVIDYLGEQVTDDLQTSYDAFVGYYDDLENAKNAEDFNALLEARTAMIKNAEDFRVEAKEILGEDVATARLQIAAALIAAENELAANEKSVYDKHVIFYLASFDLGTEMGDNAITKLNEQNIDTTQLTEEINEIKSMRTTLESKMNTAYEACIGDLILVCDTTEHADYVDYRKQTHNAFRNFTHHAWQTTHMHWITKAQDRVDKERARLNEATDVNTTELETKLDEIDVKLDEAKTALEAGDWETARTTMQDARKLHVEYIKLAITVLKKKVNTGRLKVWETVGNTTEKLIDNLDAKGFNVSAHKLKLVDAKTAYNEAETACANEDSTECNTAIEKVRGIYTELKALAKPVRTTNKVRSLNSSNVKPVKPHKVAKPLKNAISNTSTSDVNTTTLTTIDANTTNVDTTEGNDNDTTGSEKYVVKYENGSTVEGAVVLVNADGTTNVLIDNVTVDIISQDGNTIIISETNSSEVTA